MMWLAGGRKPVGAKFRPTLVSGGLGLVGPSRHLMLSQKNDSTRYVITSRTPDAKFRPSGFCNRYGSTA